MCRFHRYEAGYDYCLKYNMLADCNGSEDNCDVNEPVYKEGKDILRSKQESEEVC